MLQFNILLFMKCNFRFTINANRAFSIESQDGIQYVFSLYVDSYNMFSSSDSGFQINITLIMKCKSRFIINASGVLNPVPRQHQSVMFRFIAQPLIAFFTVLLSWLRLLRIDSYDLCSLHLEGLSL